MLGTYNNLPFIPIVHIESLYNLFFAAHLWKQNRKIFNPTFNPNTLASYVPIFNAKSRILIDVLNKNIGNTFDVYYTIYKCTLDITVSKDN